MKVINPADGTLIRELTEDTPSTVADKYRRAREASRSWRRVVLADRLARLAKFRELVVRDQEKLARLLSGETGKPISQARNELKGVLPRIDFFLEACPRALEEQTVLKDPGMEERISHEPLGVVANISAWNYPWFVGSNVFVPALMTGNAVLYKPSEFAALTGMAITEALWEAGFPRELFIPVIGGGAVGAELLKQPVDGVFFTGSYPTGKRIAEAVAGRMIRVQLELGGKDPVYVAEDADVAKVAEGIADGAFYNSGQSCCSVERIYVHEKIHDAFVEAFVRTVRGFVTGDPSRDETYIGPLTRSAQLEVLQRQAEDAQAKGARLEIGGRKLGGKGAYFEPTVFTNVTHAMELMREESFGPIIGIQKVRDDLEALKLMNDTEYG
jgi:acyl-CoA reductase-like NAD-dependent aldehyde dehydrogenase